MIAKVWAFVVRWKRWLAGLSVLAGVLAFVRGLLEERRRRQEEKASAELQRGLQSAAAERQVRTDKAVDELVEQGKAPLETEAQAIRAESDHEATLKARERIAAARKERGE